VSISFIGTINKTDCHDRRTEILLKVALNTIEQTNQPLLRLSFHFYFSFLANYGGILDGFPNSCTSLHRTNENPEKTTDHVFEL
jgi:hypothetical protein